MNQNFYLGSVTLVLALMCANAARAELTVTQADATARKALALNQYSLVLKSYDGFDRSELNEQSLYRLAIAYQRLGLSVEAKKALDQALAKNPSGTFSSSPARLALLMDNIQSGLAKLSTADGVYSSNEKRFIDPLAPASDTSTRKSQVVSTAMTVTSPIAASSGPDVNTAFVGAVAADVRMPVIDEKRSTSNVPTKSSLFVPTGNVSLVVTSMMFFVALIFGGIIGWFFNHSRASKTIAQLRQEKFVLQVGGDVKKSTEAIQAEAGLAVRHLSQILIKTEMTAEENRLRTVVLQDELQALRNRLVSDIDDLAALHSELIKVPS